ncbi:RNA-binding domain-containing protein [Pedobacter sp. MC2016-24]|uniref:RNA-binding domain-containing protein n=1 Tax=Pedobacter sp. MC2016-24 TaxID=2780090 RepID=UPI00187F1B64|nr:RNA-binding domain-containing protein [Pedobacter sp. MC2016-24]MBE9598473.1 putative DNA binding domain-containing protein [Pedobacter sp. MC2016-24]
MPLHINIHDLIAGRIVEDERIEYKKGWNPGSVYRSICAFANDFDDIGGGYIIIGIEEKNGRPVLPIAGVDEEEIDKIQKDMIGFNNLINPAYHAKVSIEEYDGKKILVIWALSGNSRPYEVPDEIKAKDKKYHYYIRVMASSVIANKEQREELIALSNKIPFDDRGNTKVDTNDISFTLLKEHLRQTNSRLLEWTDEHSKTDVLALMELLSGPPELVHPRNVALMLFTDDPEKYFPSTRVEIVNFPNGADDPEFFEVPAIVGPVPNQIRQTLQYLKTNILKQKTKKIAGQAESVKVWNYPYEAFEEIIANALYHRDYQEREPVEVRIYPDHIMVINYGGPDRSIKPIAFKSGTIIPRRYRNRRLGDFLKELDLTEGKATGIPRIKKAMKMNGSPAPVFDTDEDRSYFQVTLHIHPEFAVEAHTGNEATKHTTENLGSIANGEAKVEGNEGANVQANEGANAQAKNRKDALKGQIAIPGGQVNINAKAIEEIIEGAIEGATTRKRDKIARTLKAIIEHENNRIPEYVKITGYHAKTLESYIRQLREAGFIAFTEGGTKIGGYYITDMLKAKLKEREV